MYCVKQIKNWTYWILGFVFLLSLTPTMTYAQEGQLDIVSAVDESGSMSDEHKDAFYDREKPSVSLDAMGDDLQVESQPPRSEPNRGVVDWIFIE